MNAQYFTSWDKRCGVVAALLPCALAKSNSATAQKGAALFPLEGDSAPPHLDTRRENTKTRAQLLFNLILTRRNENANFY